MKIPLPRAEINPDESDNVDATPLSLAASGGYGEVVKLLPEGDEVNPDKLNHYGKTLLAWGEVSPDKQDNSGSPPPPWAADGGCCYEIWIEE